MSIWRTVVQMSGGALPDPGVNVFHARLDEQVVGEFGTAFTEIGAALNTFYDAIKGLYPTGVTISHDGLFQEINTASPRQVDSGGDWTETGTGTSGDLPAYCAMTVTWRTSLSNRSGRGRSFIGPLVKSCVEDNGTPEESNRSALQVAALNLVDASDNTEAFPWALGVWSPTDNVIRDFTGASVPNKMAVLRSRRD